MKNRSERGSLIVESSIAVTLILLTLFAAVEYARALWTWQAVAAAANDGARRAIVLGAHSETSMIVAAATVDTYVENNYAGLNPDDVVVETTWPDGTNEPGDSVRVTVSQPFASVIPLGLPPTLSATSEMEIVH
jgi:Flp pilus assembly protein TadG